jgi:hypothetical protein
MASANDPSAQPGVVLRLTQYAVINTDITTAQTVLTNTNATPCVITAVIVRNPSAPMASGTVTATTPTGVVSVSAAFALAVGHVNYLPTPASADAAHTNAILNQGESLTVTLSAATGTAGTVAYVDVLGYLV